MPPKPIPFEERFWPKVEKTETCWIWTARKTHDGYGVIGSGGRSGRTIYAHRYTYETLVGPIPAGMQIDHLCHTNDPDCIKGDACPHRACVNPAHLEPVSGRENANRGSKAQQTHCKRGHEFTPGNTMRVRGRRRCRTCRNMLRRLDPTSDLPVCLRCGTPIHRVGSGWRHAINQGKRFASCGLAPLVADVCRPILAADSSTSAAVTA